MDQTGGEGDALELHWAVAAIDAEDRRSAVALAERLCARGDFGGGSLQPAERERIELLAGAWDLAGRDRLEARAGAQAGEQVDQLLAQVEHAADRAFLLWSVLPAPEEAVPRLLRALHLSALSVVGQRRGDWERWLAAHPLPPPDEREPWDLALLRSVVETWCELHRRAGPSGLGHAMELLARTREERTMRESRWLADVPPDERGRARFWLFALHHLTDAATALYLFLSHGRPPSIDVVVARHVELAREATSGDFRLEVVLVWLLASARVVAGRRTGQLEIPGVRA